VRVDVPKRASARARAPAWLVVLPLVATLVIGVAIPLIGADAFDQFMSKRGWRPGEPRGAAIQAWATGLGRSAQELPTLRFDIKFKQYKRLLDKRAIALKLGRLHSSNLDFVSGKLTIDGDETSVKLRLQGDDVEAIRGEKWPIRVRVRGGGHVLGMERFTLRPPVADGFYDKALAYASLRGIALVPRYQFVRVVVNGKQLGAVGMEEYLSNELVEANERPPGPIMRIAVASVLPRDATATTSRATVANVADLRAARAEVVRAGRWQKTAKRRLLAARGTALLDGFLNGQSPASAVFDEAVTPRFLAAVEGVGAPQLLRWDNLRWYYNPVVDRLEPVAYAADSVIRGQLVGLVRGSPITERVLRDPLMARRFRTAKVKPPKLLRADALRDEYPMALFHEERAKAHLKRVERAVRRALVAPLDLPTAATSTVADAIRNGLPLTLGPGVVVVDRPIRLAMGATLTVLPGTTLRLRGRGAIVVRGDTVIGGRQGRVKLELDAANPDSSQRPFVFADGAVHMQNTDVSVQPGGLPRREALITAHSATVRLQSVRVSGGIAGASVALLRSGGQIDGLHVQDCGEDGVALVHTEALKINLVSVKRCKGDGVDVRGAQRGLKVTDVRASGIGDKAVSIGAAARVELRSLKVSVAAVGLSVKDGSYVLVDKVEVAQVTGAAIATFTKNSRFGKAVCVVRSLTDGSGGSADKLRLVRYGDTILSVNGAEVSPTPGALDQLYKLGWLGAR
jgi:hypothetical protein